MDSSASDERPALSARERAEERRAKERWRTLAEFPHNVGAIIDRLAAEQYRKRATMAKVLILEALASRGLWDMENNRPIHPSSKAKESRPPPNVMDHPHRNRRPG